MLKIKPGKCGPLIFFGGHVRGFRVSCFTFAVNSCSVRVLLLVIVFLAKMGFQPYAFKLLSDWLTAPSSMHQFGTPSYFVKVFKCKKCVQNSLKNLPKIFSSFFFFFRWFTFQSFSAYTNISSALTNSLFFWKTKKMIYFLKNVGFKLIVLCL